MKTFAAVILLVSVLNTSSASAQLLRWYGFKVGPTVADQRFVYSSNWPDYIPYPNLPTRHLWGFEAGVFVEFLNLPYFSLVSEVDYSQKGRIITIDVVALDNNSPFGYVDLGPQDQTLRFHYISIPILAKFRLQTPTITPFVAFGPRFEYLVSHPSSPVYDKFNRLEVAASASAGIEMDLGILPEILLEIVYSPSLTYAYRNEFVTVNNRVIALLVGASL